MLRISVVIFQDIVTFQSGSREMPIEEFCKGNTELQIC